MNDFVYYLANPLNYYMFTVVIIDCYLYCYLNLVYSLLCLSYMFVIYYLVVINLDFKLRSWKMDYWELDSLISLVKTWKFCFHDNASLLVMKGYRSKLIATNYLLASFYSTSRYRLLIKQESISWHISYVIRVSFIMSFLWWPYYFIWLWCLIMITPIKTDLIIWWYYLQLAQVNLVDLICFIIVLILSLFFCI